MRRGFVQLIIPILLGVVIVILAAYFSPINKTLKNKGVKTSMDITPSDTLTNQDAPVSTSPEPSKPITITPTKPQSTATPKPTQIIQKLNGVCTIIATVSGSNPLELKLTYSLTNSQSAYMTGAQWDFNGDGNWDTNYSLDNGIINHNFQSNGTYNVKLHLKLSDGSETAICTNSLTVPQGFQVTFHGRVYSDNNCNNIWDTNEQFISGITINIFKKPEWSLYKTLTTDSFGVFSFSTILNTGENLTVNPSAVGTLYPPYYKIYYQAPDYTLDKSNTNLSSLLSIVPAENINSCP